MFGIIYTFGIGLREGVAKVAPSYFGAFLQGVAGRLAQARTMQKPQNSWDYLAETDGFGMGISMGKAGTPKEKKLFFEIFFIINKHIDPDIA